jgi:hypothetical protein
MRSSEIKIHRTDGSSDDADNERLIGVRAAIQSANYGTLAAKVVLLHDHKGNLSVFHFEELDNVEKRFVRSLREVNCEPAENLTFIALGRGDGRYE